MTGTLEAVLAVVIVSSVLVLIVEAAVPETQAKAAKAEPRPDSMFIFYRL